MGAERAENQGIKEYLQMTYKIANQYNNKQWSDVNIEEQKKEIRTRQVIQGGMRLNDLQEIQKEEGENGATGDNLPSTTQ